MKIIIPAPVSVGLFLSYKCNAACRHCMYGCSPRWKDDWISESDLKLILEQLAKTIEPAPFGPDSVALNHGLHFTGGEPFMNFPLLCRAVQNAHQLHIPSTFVETNCFWAVDERQTRNKLQTLQSLGLKGIMISVNPFYLEYVPFERTLLCVEIGSEIFGANTMVYQLEFLRRFLALGIRDRLSLDNYLKLEKNLNFLHQMEFFMMGRAVYQVGTVFNEFFPGYPASYFFYQPCDLPFLRSWHNHVDNYGNYLPGFCGGISLGDARNLSSLITEGIDINKKPILQFIIENDFAGFFYFACRHGFKAKKNGYYSKCHLCLELRKFLSSIQEYRELQPKIFYQQIDKS
jgi:hypothetical protein